METRFQFQDWRRLLTLGLLLLALNFVILLNSPATVLSNFYGYPSMESPFLEAVFALQVAAVVTINVLAVKGRYFWAFATQIAAIVTGYSATADGGVLSAIPHAFLFAVALPIALLLVCYLVAKVTIAARGS